MSTSMSSYMSRAIKLFLISAAALFSLFFLSTGVQAFTLNVVGCDASNNCNAAVSGFRWLLEEDNTNQSPPGVRVGNSIGLDIHNSYAPVAAWGPGTSGMTIAVP